jgi:hypothetical protein
MRGVGGQNVLNRLDFSRSRYCHIRAFKSLMLQPGRTFFSPLLHTGKMAIFLEGMKREFGTPRLQE